MLSDGNGGNMSPPLRILEQRSRKLLRLSTPNTLINRRAQDTLPCTGLAEGTAVGEPQAPTGAVRQQETGHQGETTLCGMLRAVPVSMNYLMDPRRPCGDIAGTFLHPIIDSIKP